MQGGRKVKKIILLIFIVLTTFITSLSVYGVDELNTLVVHYYRYDGEYDNYYLHLWNKEPDDKGGIDFAFGTDADQYGVSLSIDLKSTPADNKLATATRLGFIIKQGEGWKDNQYREPGGDRFVYVDEIEVINGIGHVYFVQVDIRIGKSQADLANNIPDYRPKVISAAFNNKKEINVVTSHVSSSYRLLADGEEVMTGTPSSTSFVVKSTSIDLTKRYEIEVMIQGELRTRNVDFNGLYDTQEFEEVYTYEGELGAMYSKNKTTFRLWAPVSQAVKLNLYNQGHPKYNRLGQLSDELTPYVTHDLTPIENGAWEAVVDGDLDGKYYTFTVNNNGIEYEVTDPYSYSTGANGLRSMVVNFEKTNPAYWEYDERPRTITNFTDYIVWELHVRDLTTHATWNGLEAYRGKFLGLTQSGTTYTENGVAVTTGLDHIEELGVNAVQLLPIFDFGYVDEVQAFLNPNYSNIFNWGYMPYHYNVLEGSYSSNPFDGYVRMYEFKQVVQALHERDIRVIMDVVYNHTGESETSNFNRIVPGYYHRLTDEGGYSNGSGTGNETASERSMVRKLMIDSLSFLATEYHLSGFRFDLMALHDIETMNQIREKMDEIDPTIVLYGEPWTGGGSVMDPTIAAGYIPGGWKTNVLQLDRVGAFNDDTRGALKGDNDGTGKGWLQGNTNAGTIEALKYGITGGISGTSSNTVWHGDPNKHIVYISAHDNLTLHDKLVRSGITQLTQRKQLQIQANAVVLTSQGIPFLHAGVEMMRSKPLGNNQYEHNSYQSPDSVNQLNWARKLQYLDVFEYYKTLIQIRKTYPQFRMNTAAEIQARLQFLPTNHSNDYKSIAFKISGVNGQSDIVVIHSGVITDLTQVTLNDGKTYQLLTSSMTSNMNGLGELSGTLFALPSTTSIYVEVKEGLDDVEIINPVVTIAKGTNFDELSNVNLGPNAKAYATQVDTSIPGTYTVVVNTFDYLGRQTQLSYTLVVTGNNESIKFGGLS